jgi:DNA (cytosine-5)-methyltransferase 1
MEGRNNFTFIDLFSGIGGFRIAMEKLGGRCLGFSEIAPRSIETYKNNFDTTQELELGDITKLRELPNVDILSGGVPCQSWSVAGKKKGFDDPRGQLWMDVIRLVEINRPKAFVFENVKGLHDPKHKDSLDFLVSKFKESQYNIKYKILNAFDYGLAQNRDRIFIVGFKDDLKLKQEFNFPSPKESIHKLFKVFDGLAVDPDVFKKKKFHPRDLFGERIPVSRNRFQKDDELNDFFILCDTRNGHTTIHSWEIKRTSEREKEICMAVMMNRRKSKYGEWDGNPLSLSDISELVPNTKKQELEKLIKKGILRKEEDGRYELACTKNSAGIDGVYRVFMPNSDIFSTITATENRDMVALATIKARTPKEYKNKFIKEILIKKKFRPISAREAARLQGFPEWFKLPEKERLAKEQLGNAVPVNVVYYLMEEIIRTGIFN